MVPQFGYAGGLSECLFFRNEMPCIVPITRDLHVVAQIPENSTSRPLLCEDMVVIPLCFFSDRILSPSVDKASKTFASPNLILYIIAVYAFVSRCRVSANRFLLFVAVFFSELTKHDHFRSLGR
jgi:hypothetical protein